MLCFVEHLAELDYRDFTQWHGLEFRRSDFTAGESFRNQQSLRRFQQSLLPDQLPHHASATGAAHPSLGQRPRCVVQKHFQGLKARITGGNVGAGFQPF